MGILSCGRVPCETERELVKSDHKSGGNVNKTNSRMQREKLPMVLVIFLSWVFQCQVSNLVAVGALSFTEALPKSEIGLALTVDPLVPTVQAPSPVGSTPQQPIPTPPAPKQTAGQLLQLQQVLSSLRVNSYTTGAQYISDYLFLLPLGSTVFVPTNFAFDGMNASPLGPLLAYHAIMQQLSYQQLVLLPVGTRFATMIANNMSSVVTSVAPDAFRVDNVRVVQGNICSSNTLALQISCHGVDGIFNMTEWGGANAGQLAPVPSPAFDEPPISELSPQAPTVEGPSAPSPDGTPPKSGAASRVQRRHTMFSVIFDVPAFAAVLTTVICS